MFIHANRNNGGSGDECPCKFIPARAPPRILPSFVLSQIGLSVWLATKPSQIRRGGPLRPVRVASETNPHFCFPYNSIHFFGEALTSSISVIKRLLGGHKCKCAPLRAVTDGNLRLMDYGCSAANGLSLPDQPTPVPTQGLLVLVQKQTAGWHHFTMDLFGGRLN